MDSELKDQKPEEDRKIRFEASIGDVVVWETELSEEEILHAVIAANRTGQPL